MSALTNTLGPLTDKKALYLLDLFSAKNHECNPFFLRKDKYLLKMLGGQPHQIQVAICIAVHNYWNHRALVEYEQTTKILVNECKKTIDNSLNTKYSTDVCLHKVPSETYTTKGI